MTSTQIRISRAKRSIRRNSRSLLRRSSATALYSRCSCAKTVCAIRSSPVRYRAARLAGLKTVPVVLTEANDDTLMEISLVENIQREDLNPIEEAAALKLLMQQHDLTQEEVSERVGKSRSAIANALRLLTLSKPVQAMVKDGTLSTGHGKMLAGVADAKLQKELAEKCVQNDWSVRRLEDELRFAAMEKKPKTEAFEPSVEFKAALHRLRSELGTKVAVQGDEQKGKLIIHYYSKDDLDRIYRTIVGEEEE